MPTDTAIERVFTILASAGDPNSPVLATSLYEEGWLLRLILAIAAEGIDCLPFKFAAGSRWFSEARLYSAFKARFQGDPLAETHSHADGAVGHIVIGAASKSGLTIDACGSQFVIIESKVSSALRPGTKRMKYFDQAARTVACMAHTIRRCGQPVDRWQSLAFYVFAPKMKIDAGTFDGQMSKDSINKKIERYIGEYPAEEQGERREFQNQWVAPLLDRIVVECVTWESVIAAIMNRDPKLGGDVQNFYQKTLLYNGLPKVFDVNRRFGIV